MIDHDNYDVKFLGSNGAVGFGFHHNPATMHTIHPNITFLSESRNIPIEPDQNMWVLNANGTIDICSNIWLTIKKYSSEGVFLEQISVEPIEEEEFEGKTIKNQYNNYYKILKIYEYDPVNLSNFISEFASANNLSLPDYDINDPKIVNVSVEYNSNDIPCTIYYHILKYYNNNL